METYLVVRAHGLKTRLLGKDDYVNIVRGKRSLSDYMDYSAIREDMELKDKVNEVYRVYVSRMNLLARVAPDYGEFLYALTDKLEIENFKIQLRNVLGRRAPPYFYPYGRKVGPAKLREVQSEEELWELLEKTPYMKGVKKPPMNTVAEKEFFLDVLYYLYLLSSIEDKNYSKRLEPVKEAIRMEYLVKLYYWSSALGKRFWELLAQMPKPFSVTESSFSALTKKLKVDEEKLSDLIARRRLTEAMNELTVSLIKYVGYIVRPYTVELPFLYLYNMMAYVEAVNLERVIIGLDTGLAEENILSSLMFFK